MPPLAFLVGLRLCSPTLIVRVDTSVQGSPDVKEQGCPSPDRGKDRHRFWDRTNSVLFAGVAATRALDFASTRHFRSRGNNEVLLTNAIVDDKPLFAAIELAGAAASVGASAWLHRRGHHKLERWVSIIHIGVTTFGAVRNFRLRPVHPPGAGG